MIYNNFENSTTIPQDTLQGFGPTNKQTFTEQSIIVPPRPNPTQQYGFTQDTLNDEISIRNRQTMATITNPLSVITGDTTTVYTNSVLLVDATAGTTTITLMSAVGIAGKMFTIKKIDSSVNPVYVTCQVGETIDGETSQDIYDQYDAITVISNGSNYFII